MGMTKMLHTTDHPLFLLCCVQLIISIRDLDLLTIGMVNDMYAESSNDEYKDETMRRSLRRRILMHFSRIHASYIMTMC